MIRGQDCFNLCPTHWVSVRNHLWELASHRALNFADIHGGVHSLIFTHFSRELLGLPTLGDDALA
jgi:hypothetical protein